MKPRPRTTRIDPTRTTMLRRGFARELAKRYQRLRLAIWRLLVDEGALGPTANERFAYDTNPRKVERFREWLREQMDSTLAGDRLIAEYIARGYQRGLTRGYEDGKKGLRGEAAEALAQQGSKEQFLRQRSLDPNLLQKVKLLAGRTFHDLDGINAALGARMSRLLADGLVTGKTPREMAEQMADEIGLAINRARAIVNTSLTSAHAEAQLDAMGALGVEEVSAAVEWDTAADGRVCPMCRPLEGVVFKLEDARGLIPRHIGCLVGESIVNADDALAVMKTHYTGEVIELVTAKGRRLSVTQNHILLTEFGFIPARFACQGLKVVDATAFDALAFQTPDDDARQPCIADVFAALAEHPLMLSERVPLAPENLHGDGAFCDPEIDVVRPHGMLWDEASGRIEFPEGKLEALESGGIKALFADGGAAAQFLERVAFAADRSVGRGRDAAALCLGSLLHAHLHGLATVPWGHPGPRQAKVNGAATATEHFRQCFRAHPLTKQFYDSVCGQIEPGVAVGAGQVNELTQAQVDAGFLEPSRYAGRADAERGSDFPDRLAALVEFDEIVRINVVYHDRLPVYDVHTRSTLYRVNGLVASNCRCAWGAAWQGRARNIDLPKNKEKRQQALGQSVRAETGERSNATARQSSEWAGADVTNALLEFSRLLRECHGHG